MLVVRKGFIEVVISLMLHWTGIWLENIIRVLQNEKTWQNNGFRSSRNVSSSWIRGKGRNRNINLLLVGLFRLKQVWNLRNFPDGELIIVWMGLATAIVSACWILNLKQYDHLSVTWVKIYNGAFSQIWLMDISP